MKLLSLSLLFGVSVFAYPPPGFTPGQPGGPGRPSSPPVGTPLPPGLPDNPSRPPFIHPIARILDGNDWSEQRPGATVYDFSDVEVNFDGREVQSVSFDVSAKTRLWGWHSGHENHFGGPNRPGNDEVTCKGAGTYDVKTKLVQFFVVCPSRWEGRSQTSVHTLKLDYQRWNPTAQVELEGVRMDYYTFVDQDRATTSQVSTNNEKLIRLSVRPGGPHFGRRPHGENK